MSARTLVHARSMRRAPTDAERRMWLLFRDRRFLGYKFRRQVPLGACIADFVCFAPRVIIEIDGGQHSTAVSYDAARSRMFAEHGFRVLRFWNNEVLADPIAVADRLLVELRRW